jgi:hypothetical protein
MKFLKLSSVAILAVTLVAGCTDPEDLIAFDGPYFKSKLSKVDKQRDQFVVEVSPASASLDGAREAGRYEATKYCIAQYGTSSIAWEYGPDAEDGTLRVENDKLQFRGACAP